MAIVVDEVGHLDGSFLLYDGTEVPVSGQATGRAVTLIVSLPNGGRLYGTGGADADVVSCAFTDMGGAVVGPHPGDFGDWVVLKKRHFVPEGSACLLGDPDCPPDLGPIEPPPSGGGGYSGPDPCESEAYKSCPDLCQRAGISNDCAGYCADTFFCND
jgi:hypothetical protein